MRNAYNTSAGKPEGKRPLERHTWEDNIKTNLMERVWEGVDWIHGTLVNTVMNLWVPLQGIS